MNASLDFSTPSASMPYPIINVNNFERDFDFLSRPSAEVNVNGYLKPPFPLNRGTRQGNPISPTLFVLGIEALNRLLL